MQFVKVLMIALEGVCSLLMIGVILLQKSKSEGMGLAFGSNMGESLFGSRAGNVLQKITVVLGIIFLLNTLGLAIVFAGMHRTAVEKGLGPRRPAASVPASGRPPAPAAVPSEQPSGEAPALEVPPSAAAPAEAPAAPAEAVPAAPAP